MTSVWAMPGANAAYDQWDYYAAVDPGTKFDTEAEAAEHMRSFGGRYQYLTIPGDITQMAMSYAAREWRAPDKDPFYIDEWSYLNGPSSNPGPFQSEEELLAAHYAYILESIAPCSLESWVVDSEWTTDTSFLYLPTRQHKQFHYDAETRGWNPITESWDCIGGDGNQGSVTFWRDRQAQCPTYYSQNLAEQICELTFVSQTYRNTFTRSCPNEGAPCEENGTYDECSDEGNPCNAATGNKKLLEPDYSSPGIEFVRQYNTLFGLSPWGDYYTAGLVVDGSTPLGLITHQGYDEPFKYYGPNQYVSYTGAGVEARLEGGEWVISYPSGTREFFSSSGGPLLRRQDPSGLITTISYGSNSKTITGPFGHSVTLELSPIGKFLEPTKLIQPDGQEILYEYAAGGELWKVHYPDGSVREYHYEDLNFFWLVTGITDENGDRYSTYTYDAAARVVTSEHTGGYGKVSLNYLTDSTIVTDAVRYYQNLQLHDRYVASSEDH